MNEEDRKRLAQRLADVQKNLATWRGSSEPSVGGGSTEDWSTIPLRGFRKFLIRDGSLTGVTYQWRITPGVNDSMCGRGVSFTRAKTAVANGTGLSDGWDLMAAAPPGPDHELQRCSCGFHAVYTSPNFDDFWGFAEGMMEGWGEVVTGPLGFRATKARVVALCFNTHIPMRGHLAYDTTPKAMAEQIEQVKKNYDVPIFNSRADMLREFSTNRGEFPVDPTTSRVRPPYGGGRRSLRLPTLNPNAGVPGCDCPVCERARGR